MTNILSFSLVRKEYMITYDREDFIIHQAAKGYLDMVFKPHKSGLHVYDPDNPKGLASYLFMETVESNMASFTKRQIHGANLARNLQAGLAFPSNQDMKWAIQSNLKRIVRLLSRTWEQRLRYGALELQCLMVRQSG